MSTNLALRSANQTLEQLGRGEAPLLVRLVRAMHYQLDEPMVELFERLLGQVAQQTLSAGFRLSVPTPCNSELDKSDCQIISSKWQLIDPERDASMERLLTTRAWSVEHWKVELVVRPWGWTELSSVVSVSVIGRVPPSGGYIVHCGQRANSKSVSEDAELNAFLDQFVAPLSDRLSS